MPWCLLVKCSGLPANEGEAGVAHRLQCWSTDTRQTSLWLGNTHILRKTCHWIWNLYRHTNKTSNEKVITMKHHTCSVKEQLLGDRKLLLFIVNCFTPVSLAIPWRLTDLQTWDWRTVLLGSSQTKPRKFTNIKAIALTNLWLLSFLFIFGFSKAFLPYFKPSINTINTQGQCTLTVSFQTLL